MPEGPGNARWRTDGKFFRAADTRVRIKAATYGPFPGGWPAEMAEDFQRMAEAGFNAVRLYEMPSAALLDAAEGAGVRVFAGLEWEQSCDFLATSARITAAKVALVDSLRRTSEHPAFAGVFVGNEVPADLVRWMGPDRVRRAIEELIDVGRDAAPALLFAYANYPSTEYLEPANADFTAMNVFLEDEAAFRAYVRRLHHIAGDRPVVISEFGLDSRRNGTAAQAETLAWGARAAIEGGAAGFTVYAWSDRWWAGAVVLDWDFGLVDRSGLEKPALAAISAALAEEPPLPEETRISVIVCTRNGGARIGACLRALERQSWRNFETIVVDDGSTDGTAALVAKGFPEVKLLRLSPSGLSAARNAGAEAASGEVIAFTDDDCEPDEDWLAELARVFAAGWDCAGGPNLPPPADDPVAAMVAAAPGAPSHVMLDDEEAEHLPGCNLAVRREVLLAVGGFDPAFTTAGDDVDFCWRLQDAGFRLGFSPAAFVWHHRRDSLRGYLWQQIGYGKAEKLLMARHPARFTPSGDAKWRGFVYGGGVVSAGEGAIIYHGPMAMAGYQSVVDRVQPLRPLDARFRNLATTARLAATTWLQVRLRTFARTGRWRGEVKPPKLPPLDPPDAEFAIDSPEGESRDDFLADLLADGWRSGGPTAGWDVEKDGTRLLLATERGAGIAKRTLVRRWGPPISLPASMMDRQLG